MTTSCQFGGLTKHGRLAFAPHTTYSFEDPDAVPYFVAMGWAEEVPTPQDAVIIGLDAIDIDPLTVFGDGPRKGQYVMPERAKAALASREG